MNATLMMYKSQDRNTSPEPIAHRAQPAWMGNVLEMLRSAFASNPSVEAIAERAHVHPVHLCRSFRKHQGMTIGQYLRRLKVEHARSLLGGSELSLSEIAARCGFCDQSHFSSVFKKIAGTTPGDYRASSRSSMQPPPSAA